MKKQKEKECPLNKIFVEKHSTNVFSKPKALRFFRIIQTKSLEPNLETIIEAKRPKRCSDLIEISTWRGHNTSLWISIKKFDKTIILDSGIIESLADEIRKLKKLVLEEKK